MEMGRSSIKGWQAFAISHQLRVGNFITFQKEASEIYKVVILNYTCTEVMTTCSNHEDATRLVVEEEEV
jgi:hypothetical protein